MTDNNTSTSGVGDLKTLQPEGDAIVAPESRVGSAADAQNIFTMMITADLVRSRKRSLVKGLVDGNPPYRQTSLRNAGRADNCNVNWRISESYLGLALSAFYDIFNESPTYATVKTNHGTPEEQEIYSNILTEEFDRLQKRDSSFDYNMQISQHEMVLFGCGPFIFQDEYDWRPKAMQCGDCYVLEGTRSDVNQWELGGFRMAYRPDELYRFIINEAEATARGWDVEATKIAIMKAHPKYMNGGIWRTWEWHQQLLKNGSIYYTQSTEKSINAAHLFWKEFPKSGESDGKISHGIILESTAEQNETWLFKKVGRFDNWLECIHPMYYDHGGGGFHHSVTGMGIKMYSAMEYQNRLICKMADDAFAPKVMFKPTTPSAKEKMNLIRFGPFAVFPNEFDLQQVPINPLMNESLMFNREISGQIASNLSQYRQNLQEKSGNPITAKEAAIRSTEQGQIGKTQLNRYYAQLDFLYAEKFRRASDKSLTVEFPGGKEAKEFRDRCIERGCKPECFEKIEYVHATRITGQGSQYLRQESLEFLLGLIAMMPESGRDNLMKDVIASRAGQRSVVRYYPSAPKNEQPSEQNVIAMLQVGDMKVGIPPVVIPTQNAVIFAQTFLQAASQAAASVQQGANPMEVLQFLDICGKGIAAHLERIKPDKSRKAAYQALESQFKQIAQFTDELASHVQQMQQQAQQKQQQLAAQQSQVSDDFKLGMAKIQSDHALKEKKTDFAIEDKSKKTKHSMVLADAKTAASIELQAAKTRASNKSEK